MQPVAPKYHVLYSLAILVSRNIFNEWLCLIFSFYFSSTSHLKAAQRFQSLTILLFSSLHREIERKGSKVILFQWLITFFSFSFTMPEHTRGCDQNNPMDFCYCCGRKRKNSSSSGSTTPEYKVKFSKKDLFENENIIDVTFKVCESIRVRVGRTEWADEYQHLQWIASIFWQRGRETCSDIW